MQQVIKEQELKRISDIKMFQAQVSPHFLYNTLTSIRYMIYSSPPAEVDKILLSLNRFLKYVLSDSEKIYVTLNRELEQLANYVTIQECGFDTPLCYQVEIEPDLGNCLIVKMLLQPLIENALLHGLKPNNENPTLKIKITSFDTKNIQIVISDNGVGFDPNTLNDHEFRKQTTISHHHMGIANVRQRLLLHYGDHGYLDIQSQQGCGTVIRIVIPKETENGGVT